MNNKIEYDKESKGINFFKEGVRCLNQNKVKDAYDLFIKGLDIITCDYNIQNIKGLDILTSDCNMENWTEGINREVYFLLNNEYYNENHYLEHIFCYAFININENNKVVLNKALKSAVLYDKIVSRNNQSNEYSNYLIGRLLLQLDCPYSALHYFKFILRYCDTKNFPRIYYNIGSIYEMYVYKEIFNYNNNSFYRHGLRYLSDSIIENPSSVFCVSVLQQFSKELNLTYKLKSTYDNNELINAFIHFEKPAEFLNIYKEYLNELIANQNDLKGHISSQFIDFISYNSNTFLDEDFYTYEKSLFALISHGLGKEDIPLYILFPDYYGTNRQKVPTPNKHLNKITLNIINDYIERHKYDYIDNFDDDENEDY